MCGIIGIAGIGIATVNVAQRMLAALSHRGPDGSGIEVLDSGRVILGHARLAIVDLSPRGAQPMTMPGSRVWITLNGEIYNYRKLREDLERLGHRFRSMSDTEVLLAGYLNWGQEVLDKVDGIFAFAIWDDELRRLWLARDHLGVKPLYYAYGPRGFAFASEPRCLLLTPLASARPDAAAVRDFLSFGYLPGGRSAFADLRKLPPGHTLTWTDGSIRTAAYWQPRSFAQRYAAGETETLVELSRRIDASAEAQLEGDVPVGVLVSGGIDSTALAASVIRYRPQLHGFVLGYNSPAHDERRFAGQLAAATGIVLHERVLEATAARSLVEHLVDVHDEPFADSSSIPMLALFELVRNHGYKVVLSGDGGDELFSGYRRYDRLLEREGSCQAIWPLKLVGARNLRHAARMAVMRERYRRPTWRTYYEQIRVFSFEQQCEILQDDWRPKVEAELTWPFARYWDAGIETLAAARLFDLQTYLPEDILLKVDRTSMSLGIEARVPLLARSVVEYAFGIPTKLHLHNGQRKYLLKRMLEQRAPRDLLTNRKKGFGLPLELTMGDTLRNWRENVHMSTIARDGLVSARTIKRRQYHLDQVWSLFVLDLWWSRWIRAVRDEAEPRYG